MTEIRTTSKTGGQKGVKPERHDLMPRKGLDAIARVFGFGAEKYADHNWRNRYEWGKSLAALERHIGAFMDGETYDPESGLPHLAHAGFHILVLLTWLAEDGEGVENEMDDRWTTTLERRRLEKEAEEIDLGPEVMWQIPQAVTFQSVESSLEAIAAATGYPVEKLLESAQGYAMPLRFIAGINPDDLAVHRNAPCFVEPVLDEGIPTRPEGMSYEEWEAQRADQESDWAADIVTGQGLNGVQRSFDLRD